MAKVVERFNRQVSNRIHDDSMQLISWWTLKKIIKNLKNLSDDLSQSKPNQYKTLHSEFQTALRGVKVW